MGQRVTGGNIDDVRARAELEAGGEVVRVQMEGDRFGPFEVRIVRNLNADGRCIARSRRGLNVRRQGHSLSDGLTDLEIVAVIKRIIRVCSCAAGDIEGNCARQKRINLKFHNMRVAFGYVRHRIHEADARRNRAGIHYVQRVGVA